MQPPFVGSGTDYLGESQGPYQGFPVAPCPAGAPAPCVEGDVVATLQFWRPQRRAIAGVEEGDWTDIGGLLYATGVSAPGFPAPPACRAGEVSTTDPNLTAATAVSRVSTGAGFRDAAGDRPANPGNTLSFSVNLTKCYREPVVRSVLGPTWDPGESVLVWLSGSVGDSANVGANFAAQQLLFTMK